MAILVYMKKYNILAQLILLQETFGVDMISNTHESIQSKVNSDEFEIQTNSSQLNKHQCACTKKAVYKDRLLLHPI